MAAGSEHFDEKNGFKVHFVRNGVRCVETLDTLEEALARARTKARSGTADHVWVSDARNVPVPDNPPASPG